MVKKIIINSKKLTNTEKSILFIFLLVTLSGALRKWIVDNSVINILLTALPVLSIFIILYFIKKNLPLGKPLFEAKYLNVIGFYILILIIMAANPLNHTIGHGLIGILLHSSFWLLLFAYLSNKQILNFEKLLPYFIFISIIQISIGLIQYNSPQEDLINQYTNSGVTNIYEDELDNEDIIYTAKVSDATRASGTFSYIGGYSAYIFFILFLFISYFNSREKNMLLLIGLFLLVLLGTLTTGSRSSIIIFLITILAFFSFQLKEKKILIKLITVTTFLIIFNFILGDPIKIQSQVSTATANITERIISNQEEGNKRVSGPINTLFNPDIPFPITGVGLGTSYQGVNSFLGSSKYNNSVEHEIGRTLLDGGYILLLIKAFLFILLIKNIKGNKIFLTISLAIIYLTTLVTTNPYTNFYLALGIMLFDSTYSLKQSYIKTSVY